MSSGRQVAAYKLLLVPKLRYVREKRRMGDTSVSDHARDVRDMRSSVGVQAQREREEAGGVYEAARAGVPLFCGGIHF